MLEHFRNRSQELWLLRARGIIACVLRVKLFDHGDASRTWVSKIIDVRVDPIGDNDLDNKQYIESRSQIMQPTRYLRHSPSSADRR
jgi:hypothetical protein